MKLTSAGWWLAAFAGFGFATLFQIWVVWQFWMKGTAGAILGIVFFILYVLSGIVCYWESRKL